MGGGMLVVDGALDLATDLVVDGTAQAVLMLDAGASVVVAAASQLVVGIAVQASGAVDLEGDLVFNGDVSVDADATLTVAADAALAIGANAAASAAVALDAGASLVIAGALNLTSATITADSSATVTVDGAAGGMLIIDGTLNLGADLTVAGDAQAALLLELGSIVSGAHQLVSDVAVHVRQSADVSGSVVLNAGLNLEASSDFELMTDASLVINGASSAAASTTLALNAGAQLIIAGAFDLATTAITADAASTFTVDGNSASVMIGATAASEPLKLLQVVHSK